jgi:predicted amidohydrolase
VSIEAAMSSMGQKQTCALQKAMTALPNTISSDIHVFSRNTPGMPYLTWVMSKFMGLGFTLEQVVTMATINRPK